MKKPGPRRAAPAGADLEAQLDRLFAGPLPEFVAARDALAARLKTAGNGDALAKVKALRKPSVPAWAVNQVRFAAPDALTALLAAGDRLRSGSSDIAGIMGARREALAAARARAGKLLAAAGHAATPETMRRVSATLEALAAYGNSPGRPAAGRLTEELPAPGFDDLAALGILHGGARAKSRGDHPKRAPSTTPPPARATAPHSAEQKELKAKRFEEIAEAKEKEAERARASLLEAEGRAETLRRKRQELEKALAEAVRHERAHAPLLAAARGAVGTAKRAVRKSET